MQLALSAFFLALDNAGNNKAARIAMMAMTKSNSTSEKALRGCMIDMIIENRDSFQCTIHTSSKPSFVTDLCVDAALKENGTTWFSANHLKPRVALVASSQSIGFRPSGIGGIKSVST